MIKKKVFSKKGNLVTDNPVALILVVLVIASVLMFFYKVNINKYLRNLPGYSVPEEDSEYDLSNEKGEDKKGDECVKNAYWAYADPTPNRVFVEMKKGEGVHPEKYTVLIVEINNKKECVHKIIINEGNPIDLEENKLNNANFLIKDKENLYYRSLRIRDNMLIAERKYSFEIKNSKGKTIFEGYEIEVDTKYGSVKGPIEKTEVAGECSDCGLMCFDADCRKFGEKIKKNCVRENFLQTGCKELKHNFGMVVVHKYEQLRDTDPDLIKFIKCIDKEYVSIMNKKGEKEYINEGMGHIIVTSLTNDALYSNPPTCDLDNYEKGKEKCVHMKNSCHYYLEDGDKKSRAVDVRTKRYSNKELLNAVKSCKDKRVFPFRKKFDFDIREEIEDEGEINEHLHIEIKEC
ncbi:hypothetical protein CMI40_01360 [Candidatus Pacearchaeota archaeon]|jgi:hypothetical protein|nr:hypothetical protein [Candidatus Pacearchaeota archaeon]|tara:strand:+ start:144 stop:1355 length:1212 start_codon:yes stop_codon:yes gene_type:complete